MNAKTYMPVPPTPNEYWEDSDWADEHIGEIADAHPNLWVAVVGKKVVASGKVITEVRKAAQQKTGRTQFPIIFAEQGIHVYQSEAPFPDQD